MEKLTLTEAKRINAMMVTEDHLLLHAANVSAAMEAMAAHFGADREHWAGGCEMLQMDIRDVAEIVIEGMKMHAEELQLAGQ